MSETDRAATAGGTYPVLTTAERDRRWELARRFMDEHGLDALLMVSGGSRMGHYYGTGQHYLSNEPDGIVLLPRGSDPVLLETRNRWGLMHTDIRRGVRPWIEDFRLAEPQVPTLVGAVEERGLAGARLGVVTPMSETPYGSLAEPMWLAVAAALPELEAVDVAESFTLATLARSDEEMALVRQAAAAASAAAEAVIEVAGSGVSEVELHAAAVSELARGGLDWQAFLMVVGPEVMGYGMPRWYYPNAEPRLLSKGDVIMVEFFPTYGGIDLQQQLMIVVGEPDPTVAHLADVAVASAEAGLDALRAGNTFGAVCEAMQKPIFDAGCWDADPLIHSLPLALLGPMHVAVAGRDDVDPAMRELPPIPPRNLDVVIEDGTPFAVEPMVGLGRHRAMVGTTAVARSGGAEVLSTVGAKMHVVD